MNRFLFGLASLLLLASTRSDTQKPRDPILAARFPITATTVQLDLRDPARTRLGKLEWLGGWALKSEHKNFGGLSAIDVQGGNFIALSDLGAVIRFRQRSDGQFDQGSIAPLPKGCSKNRKKADQDTESMARSATAGPIWAGLEFANMICRFDPKLLGTTAALKPFGMRRWPRTGGAEAITWLKDGRFAAFAERAFDDNDPLTPLLLFAGDPVRPDTVMKRLSFRAPQGFRPSDAVTLPDGRVLVLTRRFALPYDFSAALVIVDPGQFKPGKIVQGREIARFASPVIADNLEALAVEETSDGTIIWIASDDNFMWLQRNLLLKFKLLD